MPGVICVFTVIGCTQRGRYVDDTFIIIKSSLKQQFTDHLNAQHPSIKFTTEDQVDNKLAMLDVLVLASPEDNLFFSVYSKPTHTNHYLKCASHQPLEHKLGAISTLMYRANTTVSNDEENIKENQHLKKGATKCLSHTLHAADNHCTHA